MIAKLLHRAGVDRAVSLGLLARAWSLLAGPVSVLLIASRFSPEQQGYYYTFASLTVLQTFLELGLGTVLIQFASHERAHLDVSRAGVSGSPRHLSRLASLTRFSLKWYGTAAPISALVLVVTGYVFFSRESSGVTWAGPWVALCLVSAASLIPLPLWALLEGCNEVAGVYRFRLLSAVATSVATWIAMVAGLGLWAAAIGLGVGLMISVAMLAIRYRAFVRSLLAVRVTEQIEWREEILPLQWRIAVSWVSGYFVYQFYTPLSFELFGPAVAGQVGMTAGLASTVLVTAFTWVATRSPQLGMLVAHGRRAELDSLFKRTVIMSAGAAVLGAGAVLLVTTWLYAAGHFLASRLLPPGPAALLLAGASLATVLWGLVAYGRAHKAEPFLPVTVAGALVTPPLAWWLGARFGITGLSLSHVIVVGLQLAAAVPVFVAARRRWSRSAPPSGDAVAAHAEGFEPVAS